MCIRSKSQLLIYYLELFRAIQGGSWTQDTISLSFMESWSLFTSPGLSPTPHGYCALLKCTCGLSQDEGSVSWALDRGWGPRVEPHYLWMEGLWQTQIPGWGWGWKPTAGIGTPQRRG